MARSGMSTRQLDDLAGSIISSLGGKSAFLGYHGYPGNVCISVNDEVVHGIGRPDRILLKGDIVSIDMGIQLDGFIGDTARTVYIGDDEPPSGIARLLERTQFALQEGLRAAKSGNRIHDISAAVESVGKRAGLGIVRDYVGHGCGCKLHEPPEVPNFTSCHKGPKLVPGMVLAIEPMFNLGSARVFVEPDNWTVRTCDGNVSAHFEHMALILDGQTEVLTCLKT